MNKTAFLFAGQGAQYPGMGREIAEKYPEAMEIFDKAASAVPFALKTYCFEGPAEELNKTEITQPAILTTSLALLEVLKKKGLNAEVTAGLSLGEYTSLVYAGSLSLETAVQLVNKRGRYMQEAVPLGTGTLAAIIGLDNAAVENICRETTGIVETSNYNCPGQLVIGGEISAVENACEAAKAKGAKRAMILPVSAPFHTSMLEPAAKNLAAELKTIEISDPQIPVISNVNADYVKNAEEIRKLLAAQVNHPVLWEKSIRRMLAEGIDTFIEIGPGRALSGFIKKIDKSVNIMNVEDLASLEKTLEKLEAL